ncbi:MAG: glycosyltransferase family 4 protein [Burkholderiaceae bacterium]|nr:glycosyltransferase family 4 protein [Burkholderiaceae bacterium]
MDVPNERSSHSVATPRGGGVAIVASWLAVLPVLALVGVLAWSAFWALLGAGALVALIGFVDDHSHVPAFWRLVAHFAAAGWLLHGLHGLPPLTLLGGTIPNGWLLQLLGALYVVWLLNLYNFMDGIDGIASVETITVCVGGALLYLLLDVPVYGVPPLLLAAAVAGFLYWNFPPARIFLGDAGSGFLGVLLAGFSIQAAWVASELFWSWMILLGVFIVDATFTLLRRLSRGERVYEAHRSHAYQRASRRFGCHLPVTLAVGTINLFWLLPIAVCVAIGSLEGVQGVLLAYAPLLALALMLGAGRREPEP